MNAPASSETTSARPASLIRACALLAAVLLALLPCFAAYGYFASGSIGILAALVACGICLACGILALCVTSIAQKMNQGIQGILGAMLVRMGVPLFALLVLPKIGGPLVAAGVTGMVMAYYLVTLAMETWLSLRFVPANKNTGANSPAAKVA
ncbi:MAG: hypothetical protein ACKVP0_07390 [Pirellulaceae bacterium]